MHLDSKCEHNSVVKQSLSRTDIDHKHDEYS